MSFLNKKREEISHEDFFNRLISLIKGYKSINEKLSYFKKTPLISNTENSLNNEVNNNELNVINQTINEIIDFSKGMKEDLIFIETELNDITRASNLFHYKNLIENIANILIIVDYNGKYLYINKSGAAKVNQLQESIIGKTMWEMQPKEHADEKLAIIRDCIDNVKSFQGDLQFRDSWSTYNIVPLKEHNNKITSVLITCTDITQKKRQEDLILRNNQLLQAINFIQSQYIDGENIKILFDDILKKVLEVTESEYGFIGKILYDSEGAPYIKTYTITDISWNEDIKAFYDKYKEEGLEFHNLKTLFGHVLTSGNYVISNSPADDERRGQLPHGHPALLAFLGYPLYSQDKMIGIIGLGNRTGGYNEELVRIYEPIFKACASITHAVEILRQRNIAEKRLKNNEKLLSDAQRIAKLGRWEQNLVTNHLWWSEEVFRIFEIDPKEFSENVETLYNYIHPDDKDKVIQTGLEAISDNKNFNIDHRIITSTGDIKYVNENAEVINNERGEAIKFVGTIQDITERKRSEEQINDLLRETQNINQELQANEEELRQTLDNAIDLNRRLLERESQLKEAQQIGKLGRWEWDLVSKKIVWSEEVYKLFGEEDTSIQITSEFYLERIYHQYRELLQRSTNESITNRKEYKFEIKINTSLGDRWAYLIVNPMSDQRGEIEKLVGITLDITERKQVEIALGKSEKLFRHLIENSNDGICLMDEAGRMLYVSSSAKKILGYTPHEYVEYYEENKLIHPDYLEYSKNEFNTLISSQDTLVLSHLRCRHKDGSWRWIESVGNNLLSDPDIKAVVINFRDITERKEAHLILEKRELHFRQLIENSHDGITISDKNNKILFASNSIQRIIGSTVEEFLDEGLLIHPDDVSIINEKLAQFLTNPGHSEVFIFRAKHKDGTYRWIENVAKNLLGDPDINGVINNFQDITERKSAEEALRNSEKKYRMLMEEASDGIFLVDDKGKYVSVNNKACQMLGYTQDELLSLFIVDVLSDDEMTNSPGRFSELKQGESILSERYLKRKDGSIFPAELSSKRLDEHTIQAFVRDITARRRTEEALLQSEAKYRRLVETSHDLIWSMNFSGIILFINVASKDILGYSPEEMTGKSFFEFSHPDHVNNDKIAFKGLLIGEETVTYESIYKHKNGYFRNLLFNAVAIRDEKGKMIGTTGTATDITERKKAEEAILGSRNYLDKIINSIPEPVFVKDIDHKWVLVNDALCETMGYSREKLLGKSDYDLFPKEQADVFWSKDNLVFETGQDNINEEVLTDVNGNLHILITKKSLYHDPAKGKLLVGIINDITERKKIEEKLQFQNDELIKINAELDKFVYRASHDLRAPLVSILGLIAITKEEREEQKKEEYFRLMEKSINKLDDFIQSIIHYSRNSRLAVQGERIDFNNLISETFEDLKYMEKSNSISKEINILDNVDFYSDVFRLKIIFSNIISNAIRYSHSRRDDSYLRINITIDEQKAIIEFVDNGIGIPEDSINRIFEMFYRASDSNVGSGLGLYIVKDVIDALKGTIEVTSIFGEGTIFKVTLPNLEEHLKSPIEA